MLSINSTPKVIERTNTATLVTRYALASPDIIPATWFIQPITEISQTLSSIAIATVQMIYDKTDRGVTLCNVKGGYTNDDLVMVICTMDEYEAYKIRELIYEIDSSAFTFMSQTKEVIGDYK